jgi:hypothetical protein
VLRARRFSEAKRADIYFHISKASSVLSMMLSMDDSSDRSEENDNWSTRLQDWLATSRSDDPWNGVGREDMLSAHSDRFRSATGGGASAPPEKIWSSAPSTKQSPRLQDWLTADASKDTYAAGKNNKVLKERQSALYTEIDEILTAFQMNRAMLDLMDQGTDSESPE